MRYPKNSPRTGQNNLKEHFYKKANSSKCHCVDIKDKKYQRNNFGQPRFSEFYSDDKNNRLCYEKRNKTTKRGDFLSQNSAAIWRRQWIPVSSHCYFLPSVAKASRDKTNRVNDPQMIHPNIPLSSNRLYKVPRHLAA